MPARPMWKGVMSFGLVPIPVGIFSLKDQPSGRLHEFHADDGGEVGYVKYCKKCGKTLEWKEPVKGEKVNGQIITYTKEELQSIAPASSKQLEIEAIVERSPKLDLMAESTYLLRPISTGKDHIVPMATKLGFSLLHSVLSRGDLVAVTRIFQKGKEHVAIIEPVDSNLILRVISYSEYIRWKELEESAQEDHVDVPEEYGKLGSELAAALMKDINAVLAIRDEYRERLDELRSKKIAGLPIPESKQEKGKYTAPPDLFKALLESIEKEKKTIKVKVPQPQ